MLNGYGRNILLIAESRDIASQLGCAKSTVIGKLREYGIEVNRPGVNVDKTRYAYNTQIHNMPASAFGKANNIDWLNTEYIIKNRSALNISRELGLSRTAVYRWIWKFRLTKTKAAKQRAIEHGYLESVGCDIRSHEAAKKRMRGRNATKINTNKAGVIWCHSSWEVDVARILDSNTKVVAFSKDSTIIPYIFNGRPKHFYVDFTVMLIDGIEALIEVKADKLLLDHRTITKLEAMYNYCQEHGFRNIIVGGKNKVRISDLSSVFDKHAC